MQATVKLTELYFLHFMFLDIMFYANTLFQPMVLSSAFGSSESIQSMARDACLIDRKSTRLNSSHRNTSRMPSSA